MTANKASLSITKILILILPPKIIFIKLEQTARCVQFSFLGMLDSGLGETHVNKFLEKEIGYHIEGLSQES